MNRKQFIDPFDSQPSELKQQTTTSANMQGRGFVDPYDNQGFIDPFDQTDPKSKLDPYINKVTETIAAIPGAQKTLSTIAPALDFISRPSYAVNKFISEYQKPEGQLLESVASAFSELFATGNKRAKLSYSDVIRQKDPEFARNNPTATQIIGFIGDVAFDPTTYLGVGAVGRGLKVAGGSLNKAGTKLVKELLPTLSTKVYVAADGTLELIEQLPKAEKAAQRTTKLAQAFEKRIKDSAVVDDAGELIPLYRGTDDVAKKIKDKRGIQGLYFTTLPEVADIYAQEAGSSVVKAFSNAKKLLDISSSSLDDDLLKVSERVGLPVDPTDIVSNEQIVDAIRGKLGKTPLEGQNKLIEELKKSGFQGIKFMSDDGGILHQQYLIFSEKNIIPAYTNKGLQAAKQVKDQTGTIAKLEETKAELTQRGYFDAVAEKSNELSKIFDAILQGKPTATSNQLATNLAKVEVMSDIMRVAGNAPVDTLTNNEVLERLTTRMTRLVEVQPNLFKQLIEPKSIYLKAGLPFGKQVPIMKIFGTDYLYKQISVLSDYVSKASTPTSKTLFTLARTFNRDFGLPQEYIKLRNELENEFGYLSEEMVRQGRKLFVGMDKTQREGIGSAMHWADDETRKLQEIRNASSDPNFRTITDGEAAQIFQQAAERYKLNPDQFAVMSGIQQAYKEAALLEMRAGLLRTNLQNYSARGYEVIEDAEDMSLITRGKYGSAIPQPYLASSKQRKFLTKEEAEAAGLTPELDAAILYAHRVLSSERALATKSFKDSVIELFGTYDTKVKTAHTGILPTAILEERLPARIISDMKMIGGSVIPSGLNDTQREWLRAIDRMQGWWKTGAIRISPVFATKQLVSNTFQSAMVLGAKAFKAFDPRVAIDAGILLMRGGKPLENLPPFLGKWLSKQTPDAILAGRVLMQRHFDDVLNDNLLNKYEMTTALGQKYDGNELVQLMREKGVIRGFDSTGESFTKKVEENLSRDANSYKRVVGVLGKVWNHASFVEDYSRAMLFMNGMKMGYSADEAVKLVNKALFDYQRGLAAIEKNVIRRAIPFYSYQRFAIPFVLKQTLNRPGDLATIEKLMRTTEKLLISGEELTPAEVDIFNTQGENFLLEQPRQLSGFDKSGTATINVLNNLTPWDVLNLLVHNKEGGIDIARTAEKTFLSALTPFLKIPATAMTNRDFFTGRTIDEASKISGNLDYSIGKVIPDWARELIGWEVRTNQISGKTTTYMNPFLAYYSMQFVPALRQYIKPLTDLEKTDGFLWSSIHAARKLIDPINETEYDFAYQEQNQMISAKKDINEIKAGLYKAKIKGDQVGKDTSFEYQDNLLRLQRFLQVLDDRAKERTTSVRGPGMGGTITDVNQVPTELPPTNEPNFK